MMSGEVKTLKFAEDKPNPIYVKNFNSKVPPNERSRTRQNDDSGVSNMEIQDSSEQRGTNKNYIDMNNTNPILSSEEVGMEESAVNECTTIRLPIFILKRTF